MEQPSVVQIPLIGNAVNTNNQLLFASTVAVGANKPDSKPGKSIVSKKPRSESEIHYEDSRGFFILPVNNEASYYNYGTPEHGQGQFAHPLMISLIFWVEAQWGVMDKRKFGVGNISLYNGQKFKPHSSHLNGLQADIRPLRKDGKHEGVNFNDRQHYDQEATKKLIELFYASGLVERVLFNDSSIPRVRPAAGHSDHFHVEIFPEAAKQMKNLPALLHY